MRAALSAVELMVAVVNDSISNNRFCQTNYMIGRMTSNAYNLTLGPTKVDRYGLALQGIDIFAFNTQATKMQVSVIRSFIFYWLHDII